MRILGSATAKKWWSFGRVGELLHIPPHCRLLADSDSRPSGQQTLCEGEGEGQARRLPTSVSAVGRARGSGCFALFSNSMRDVRVGPKNNHQLSASGQDDYHLALPNGT